MSRKRFSETARHEARTSSLKPQAASLSQAFTLLELMIVIMIIAALAGILIPGIGHFRKFQRKAAITAFAGAIQSGLVRYQQDYKELPPSYAGDSVAALDNIAARPPLAYAATWNGGEILAQAMLGPLSDANDSGAQKERPGTTFPAAATDDYDDGMNGFGFRSRTGKRSGPYIDLKNERNLRGSPTGHNKAYVLSMYYGQDPSPFLYYRANPAATATGSDFNSTLTTAAGAIWGPDTAAPSRGRRFITNDNLELAGGTDGDNAVAYWKNSKLDPEDRSAFAMELRSADYLIVHPGPDSEFGVAGDNNDEELDDIFITGKATR